MKIYTNTSFLSWKQPDFNDNRSVGVKCAEVGRVVQPVRRDGLNERALANGDDLDEVSDALHVVFVQQLLVHRGQVQLVEHGEGLRHGCDVGHALQRQQKITFHLIVGSGGSASGRETAFRLSGPG